MEFNQYNLYTMNTGGCNIPRSDAVDSFMNDLVKMDEYDEVRSYIETGFGNFEGEKWFEYPELNKHVCILIDDEKIEFCALKNGTQYFGKGWKLVS